MDFNKEVEEHNLNQIAALNQRGGRMLTLVDLLEDNTIDPNVGGFLIFCLAHNLSFLTAAGPSGTGKTTLMGSLLTMLKPGVKIETFTGNRQLPLSLDSRFLIHEINNAPYHGYVFDESVGEFFSFVDQATIAASLHADNLQEIKETLKTPYLEVNLDDYYRVDLILFMVKQGGFFHPQRRISQIYGSINGEFVPIYTWKPGMDSFVPKSLDRYKEQLARKLNLNRKQVERGIQQASKFLKDLQAREITELVAVRKHFHSFYNSELERGD